jgi:hypothetical protein
MIKLSKIVFLLSKVRKDTGLKDLTLGNNPERRIITKKSSNFSFLRRRQPIKGKPLTDKVYHLRLDKVSDDFSDNLPIRLSRFKFNKNRDFNNCLHFEKDLDNKIKELNYNKVPPGGNTISIPKERTESQRIPRKITPWEKNMNLIRSLC